MLLSRRTALAAAFAIVPRHVLGGTGYVAPSDKINLAAPPSAGEGLHRAGAQLAADAGRIKKSAPTPAKPPTTTQPMVFPVRAGENSKAPGSLTDGRVAGVLHQVRGNFGAAAGLQLKVTLPHK